jgi:hypothetical protein
MRTHAITTQRIVEHALKKPDGFIENQLRRVLQDAAVRFGPEGARMRADEIINEWQDRMRAAR